MDKSIFQEKYPTVIDFKHRRGEPMCSPPYVFAPPQSNLHVRPPPSKILKSEAYTHIYKYAIAFHKKNCEVAMEIA